MSILARWCFWMSVSLFSIKESVQVLLYCIQIVEYFSWSWYMQLTEWINSWNWPLMYFCCKWKITVIWQRERETQRKKKRKKRGRLKLEICHYPDWKVCCARHILAVVLATPFGQILFYQPHHLVIGGLNAQPWTGNSLNWSQWMADWTNETSNNSFSAVHFCINLYL